MTTTPFHANAQPTIRLSIVVPAYGCNSCLEELCKRIEAALSQRPSDWEIILVDDRSPDRSWEKIESLTPRFPQVVGIRLSRNFGQHLAITAGMKVARGDAIVIMDCDLQDPPERIPDLLAKLTDGAFDLVFARRVSREHSLFRRSAARLYFRVLSWCSGRKIDASQGTFCVLTRKVVDAFLLFNERERHFLFILHWLGFNAGTMDYDHAERHSGTSSYTFSKLFRHAIDGMLFQTTTLLHWIVRAGLICTLASFFFGLYLVAQYFYHLVPAGWTSLAVMMLFSTGLLLASLGIVGLYIGKVFDSTKQRPLYVVDQTCGARCDL